MTNPRIYIDGNDDLWVFFESENFPYIDGPFLYCFDRKDFTFKKHISLFTSTGRQLIDFSPLFAGQDSKGNFILGSELGHLAKIDQTGRQLFHKVLSWLHGEDKNMSSRYLMEAGEQCRVFQQIEK